MRLPDEDMTLTERLGALAGAGGGGARFVARRLKKDVLEIRLGTGLAPEAATALAQRVLESCGRPLATVAVPGGHALRGVMGTGLGGLNPAVVTLTVTTADDGESTVLIRGAAKEGLIKQRGGRRAAEAIASHWLRDDSTAWPEATPPD